ncbi:MAG: UvrD-helicase domain-containing protein, partial [Victivallales bacterium]|nr:UvrD-helicase domain-containing protein [Victivallales bacterium]
MNMIYNASAGTGKTWQVTELYSALVLGRPHEALPSGRRAIDPRRILLMTFTDNAAAELRQRVAERMLAAQQDEDMDLADCARRILRTLPAANISTIHAFCAGLLREHALGIGLSPNFQTLEDEERNALLDDVLKTELFQTLEKDPDLREFCAGISVLRGDYSLLNTVRSLLEKADSRGLDLSRAEAMLPEPKRTITKESFEKIRADLALFDKLPPKATRVFQTLELLLQNFPMFGNVENPPRLSLHSSHPSEGGERAKSPPSEGCPQGGVGLVLVSQLTKFTGKEMKGISDALADLKERFLTEYHYEQNIETFRAFARYVAAAARGFSDVKRARDVVDFGDQLLLARDLLKGGEFKNQFDWIIVDEVQDTSRVQCDLIESIWGPETDLVICGDRKQSIYAWRSADPNVMPDLEAAMEKRGECKKIDLKISYRSKERVITAVNELFDGIYESYDALEPLTSQVDEKPCVEFLMQETEEDGVEKEMEAVARRIRLLVDGSDEWRPKFGYDGKKFVEGEPFRYGDILILLKRSTHQPVLEKALRTAGVPYTSGGKGRGLFKKQEVRDLLLFLQVITQPQNDLALVGFLRSPFANVSDNEIVELGWDGETFDHEILRKQFFEGGSDVAERILRFRMMVGLKLSSQLVRELVRETAFDAYWAGESAGEQHLANFKKAVDWLRKAERGGQVLIGDVVRRFEKAIQSPPRSGAAEALLPDPEQNTVTLMTVHGAKGLTKRVCFVPDISFGDTSESGFAMLSPEGRLEMSLAGLAGEKIKSPGWMAAREADKGVRKLEQDNVFYVAMTRA